MTLIIQRNRTWGKLSVDLSPQTPCRKLLTSLIKGLDAHVFKLHHHMYMPNCDKRGFFRKKQVCSQIRRLTITRFGCTSSCKNNLLFALFVQCWSSRGKRRGNCWCVDQNGMPVSSSTKQRGGLSCSNAWCLDRSRGGWSFITDTRWRWRNTNTERNWAQSRQKQLSKKKKLFPNQV